ncbi:PIN domain-containing protein [Amycolatopsis panacis]|uniref:PIN domain-containing protein n=1 Tax=Amycolatopsis panacis TaxID=2340917 RepID=UPI001F2ADAEB|nr:PIN domain-containing protein [Amycolatopsis panacis]
MPFPALLDANVLLPLNTADLLLRLAALDTFQPLWSAGILDEVQRNLVESIGKTPARAQRRIGQMRAAFPDAMVTGYEPLTRAMTNNEKDRHVLAAAVRGHAQTIVSDDVVGFPPESRAPYDIETVTADGFLLDQLELYPDRVMLALDQMVTARRKPPVRLREVLERFDELAPEFATAVRRHTGDSVSITWLPVQKGALGHLSPDY